MTLSYFLNYVFASLDDKAHTNKVYPKIHADVVRYYGNIDSTVDESDYYDLAELAIHFFNEKLERKDYENIS